eukprot:UC4_evm2s449
MPNSLAMKEDSGRPINDDVTSTKQDAEKGKRQRQRSSDTRGDCSGVQDNVLGEQTPNPDDFASEVGAVPAHVQADSKNKQGKEDELPSTATISLDSPAGGDPYTRQWPFAPKRNGYDDGFGMISLMRLVATDPEYSIYFADEIPDHILPDDEQKLSFGGLKEMTESKSKRTQNRRSKIADPTSTTSNNSAQGLSTIKDLEVIPSTTSSTDNKIESSFSTTNSFESSLIEVTPVRNSLPDIQRVVAAFNERIARIPKGKRRKIDSSRSHSPKENQPNKDTQRNENDQTLCPSPAMETSPSPAISPDCVKKEGKKDDFPLPLMTPEVSQQLMKTIYNMSITDISSLNHYKGFSEEVYGEFSPNMISEIVRNTPIKPGHRFMDLGSGVGQVVMQVAAEAGCIESYGMEKMEKPAKYADSMAVEFKRAVSWFGKQCGNFIVEQGDFLDENEELQNRINNADVIFVNNYAFGPNVNHMLKTLFHDMKEGAKIVSSLNMMPLMFCITNRNLNDLGAMMSIKKIKSETQEAVSWTAGSFDYYVHTVDRSHMMRFFDQQAINDPTPVYTSYDPQAAAEERRKEKEAKAAAEAKAREEKKQETLRQKEARKAEKQREKEAKQATKAEKEREKEMKKKAQRQAPFELAFKKFSLESRTELEIIFEEISRHQDNLLDQIESKIADINAELKGLEQQEKLVNKNQNIFQKEYRKIADQMFLKRYNDYKKRHDKSQTTRNLNITAKYGLATNILLEHQVAWETLKEVNSLLENEKLEREKLRQENHILEIEKQKRVAAFEMEHHLRLILDHYKVQEKKDGWNWNQLKKLTSAGIKDLGAQLRKSNGVVEPLFGSIDKRSMKHSTETPLVTSDAKRQREDKNVSDYDLKRVKTYEVSPRVNRDQDTSCDEAKKNEPPKTAKKKSAAKLKEEAKKAEDEKSNADNLKRWNELYIDNLPPEPQFILKNVVPVRHSMLFTENSVVQNGSIDPNIYQHQYQAAPLFHQEGQYSVDHFNNYSQNGQYEQYNQGVPYDQIGHYETQCHQQRHLQHQHQHNHHQQHQEKLGYHFETQNPYDIQQSKRYSNGTGEHMPNDSTREGYRRRRNNASWQDHQNRDPNW